MAATNQARIKEYFEYWRPVLGLEGWNITLRFDEKENKACCVSDPKYLEATLGFNLVKIRESLRRWRSAHPGLINSQAEALEELVLHEMVHILNPRSSETAISQTTFALLRARAVGGNARTT